MKLKKEFLDFYNEIRIDVEANSLKDKREILQNDIESNLPGILDEHDISINKSDIRIIDQGSYKYNTTIKDDVVDRDVAVIIPLDIYENSDPRTIKKYLKRSIEIPSRTVTIKEPCVRASYYENEEEYLHIDLPLYAKYNEKNYLARGKENSQNYLWEEADPDGLNNYLCGKINGNQQLRRIICFIKKWKNEKYKNSTSDHQVPPSIGLTLLACDYFISKSTLDGDDDLLSLQSTMKAILDEFTVDKNWYTGEITSANINCNLPVDPYSDVFKKMKDASDSYMITFYKRLSKAVSDLTDAVNLESEHDAGNCVKKVLGDEFNVPEKDVEDSETKSRREHCFG